MKSEKGSTILFVLISMMFFLVIVVSLYVDSNNKVQKQEKDIQKIQKEYIKEDINNIYEKIYNNFS